MSFEFATNIKPVPEPRWGLHTVRFGLLILALYFATHSWLWFLVGAAIATLLSALAKPITALILSNSSVSLVFSKLGVADRTAAVTAALERGLLHLQ